MDGNKPPAWAQARGRLGGITITPAHAGGAGVEAR